jgi:transketolase
VRHKLGEIVVVVDHNKIQSDTWVHEVSDLGDVDAKFRAFGWHVSRCDGHDVAALERTLRSLDAVTDRPKVIIADTVKGRGVDFMEGPALKAGELYGYHSGAPSEANYLAGLAQLSAQAVEAYGALGLGVVPTETTVRNPRREPRQTDNLIAAYEKALVTEGQRRPGLAALDADLVKDCGLISFSRAFPDRFFECGIAEQDMVSMAGGMARRGALPVVHSFACFLAARPNEQIYNQCSEHSKVVYVGSLAGLLPGGPGHSHQSVRDISALAAVPHLLMAEPTMEAEVAPLFAALLDAPESAYLRLVSVKWPMPFAYPVGQPVAVGKGWVAREGRDILMVGYGPWMMANAFQAAEELLARTGLSVQLVVLPWLNRVDPDWLRTAIGPRRLVVTLDNHYVHGGQGEMVAAAVAALGLEPAVRVARIGVDALPECGTNDEVMAHHRLDVVGLAVRLEAVCAPLVSR